MKELAQYRAASGSFGSSQRIGAWFEIYYLRPLVDSPAVQRPGTRDIPGLLSHMAREKQALQYFRKEEKQMVKSSRMSKFILLLSPLALALGTGTYAQDQFPIMDKIADKVVAKYTSTPCEQLWQKKQAPPQPPSPQEQKAIQFLKTDPQMRAAFINRVAPPIANKMFDCGLIP
jgi:hypothetical protein